MLQKFGKRVMNNFGLKILAVLFAVVLWIVVVNIDDPSNSKPYTTSVSLENKSYITSMGKWADYLDGKNTITFSVYAKRSVHNTLTNANFTATADAQKIEYDEKTGTYRVPVVFVLIGNCFEAESSSSRSRYRSLLVILILLLLRLQVTTTGTR